MTLSTSVCIERDPVLTTQLIFDGEIPGTTGGVDLKLEKVRNRFLLFFASNFYMWCELGLNEKGDRKNRKKKKNNWESGALCLVLVLPPDNWLLLHNSDFTLHISINKTSEQMISCLISLQLDPDLPCPVPFPASPQRMVRTSNCVWVSVGTWVYMCIVHNLFMWCMICSEGWEKLKIIR